MKLRLFFATFLATMISLPGSAATENIPVPMSIAKLRPSIRSLTVVTIAPLTSFRMQLTDELFREFGCRYSVQDPKEVSQVMDILARADIVEAPPFYLNGPDPRVGVYIHTSRGETHSLTFAAASPAPKPEYGTYDGITSILAKNDNFAAELRAWSKPRTPENRPCAEDRK
ncbi:hypothetical protein [Massilia genomosp. 1]|uniref:Uncharacterized protein n=1 Tax=Massilia genomosp. 1 TaxID=2609280 RepID=A0ABX0N081_9BURK|nr:hypothetical protein [Massilia genomosp. 1]NHZ66088.1 hypothetical protein [Massilia genomosp. 1]